MSHVTLDTNNDVPSLNTSNMGDLHRIISTQHTKEWSSIQTQQWIHWWSPCLPLSSFFLASAASTWTSWRMRGRLVTMPVPRGSRSLPTRLSSTELLPLLWKTQIRDVMVLDEDPAWLHLSFPKAVTWFWLTEVGVCVCVDIKIALIEDENRFHCHCQCRGDLQQVYKGLNSFSDLNIYHHSKYFHMSSNNLTFIRAYINNNARLSS